MINRSQFSKIGIGTWGIGGFAERNPDNDDDKQVKALAHMLDNEMNYVELNLWTAQGHSVELAVEGLKQSNVNRDNVFLSQAIYSYTSNTLELAKEELDKCLAMFETDYMDSLSLNEDALKQMGRDDVYAWYKELLEVGTIRYINLNNPSFDTIKHAKKVFGDKLFSIEVGFNFEIRENYDNSILPYAVEHNILPVIYQPLRRNRSANRNWPILVELSEKYGKSQNQIILNWISSKGYLPLTKSETISHIDEHLASQDFTLDPEDITKLDDFRPPNFTSPKPHWGDESQGEVRIDQLSNVFDDEYDKQQGGK